MKYGLGFAALVTVLLLTGSTLWRSGGDRPVATTSMPPLSAPLLVQDETGDTTTVAEDAGAQSEAAAPSWPDGLVVIPDDGSDACPTTPIAASIALTDAMRAGGTLDPSVVALGLDGADVTASTQILGTADFPQSRATVRYQPGSALGAGPHTASVSLPDDSGTTQTYTWSFGVGADACGQQQPSPAPAPAATPGPPPAPAPSGPAGQPGQPPAGQPGQPPAPAPQTGPSFDPMPKSGILHILADHSWLGPSGDTQRTTKTETWLDLASGNARQTEKDQSGNDAATTIRNGQSIIRLLIQDKRATTQVLPDPNSPQLNEIRDELLGYRGGYEAGQLQFVAEETIDGMAAIHARAPAQGQSGGLDVWLRKDYGLILREVAYQPGDAHTVAQTHVVSYSQVELQPTAAADLFAPAIASDWTQTTSKILTTQTAASLHDYDLYWLGTDYPGFTLVNLSQESVSGAPPQGAPQGAAPSGPQSFVLVAYVQTPTDPQAPPPQGAPNSITIFERHSDQPQQPRGGQQGQQAGPPGSEQVTVNGNRGLIINPPPPPTPQPSQQQAGPPPQLPIILDMTIGGTEVTIQGKDRATVMQTAQDLKRLNP